MSEPGSNSLLCTQIAYKRFHASTSAECRYMSAASHASDYADRIRQKFERELGDLVVGNLRDPDVIEIMLNPDGGLWVERFGRPMARLGEMPPHQAEAAMATLASIHRTTITRI